MPVFGLTGKWPKSIGGAMATESLVPATGTHEYLCRVFGTHGKTTELILKRLCVFRICDSRRATRSRQVSLEPGLETSQPLIAA
eukprot:995452-Pleurochrysis_carterae.AAC.1